METLHNNVNTLLSTLEEADLIFQSRLSHKSRNVKETKCQFLNKYYK